MFFLSSIEMIGEGFPQQYFFPKLINYLDLVTDVGSVSPNLSYPLTTRTNVPIIDPSLHGNFMEENIMRKVIVLSFITLDGVMQAPGGPTEDTSGGFAHGGWVVPHFDEFLGTVMGEQMSQPFDLLLGRKTFEIFASYWPHHPEEAPGIANATKFVASTTMTSHDWHKTVFLKGDVVDEIRKLKGQDAPDLQVHGSSNLIQTLLKHDLIDEFWLKIFPVTLGSGKRLFAEGTMPAGFKLSDSQVSPAGVIIAKYERAGEVKTGTVEP
jgi:dihydrofolate reductase